MIAKSVALLFLSGMVAFVVLADRGFPTAESAALKSSAVRNGLSNGYRVVDITTRPYHYAGALADERRWGSVVLVLRRTEVPPQGSSSWLVVTCGIECELQGDRIHYRVKHQDRVVMRAR